LKDALSNENLWINSTTNYTWCLKSKIFNQKEDMFALILANSWWIVVLTSSFALIICWYENDMIYM